MLKLITLVGQTPLGYNFIWVWHMDIKRLVCKIPEPYCSWNNMAFHCITSWSDWIFLSQQSCVVIRRNRLMGYVDKGDRMANSYSINRRTWKWTKKLFFHLFDLTILNSHILFSSLGGKKISQRFSEYPNVEFIGTGWAWTECAQASRKTTYHSHSSPKAWRTWQATLAYSICHAKKM